MASSTTRTMSLRVPHEEYIAFKEACESRAIPLSRSQVLRMLVQKEIARDVRRKRRIA